MILTRTKKKKKKNWAQVFFLICIGQGRIKSIENGTAIDDFLHMYDTAYWVVNEVCYVMYIHVRTYIHKKGVFNARDFR